MGEKRLASSPPLKPSKREVSRNKLLLGMGHLSRLERESQSNLSTLVDGLSVNFSRDCEEGLGWPLVLNECIGYTRTVHTCFHHGQGVNRVLRSHGYGVDLAREFVVHFSSNSGVEQRVNNVVVWGVDRISFVVPEQTRLIRTTSLIHKYLTWIHSLTYRVREAIKSSLV